MHGANLMLVCELPGRFAGWRPVFALWAVVLTLGIAMLLRAACSRTLDEQAARR